MDHILFVPTHHHSEVTRIPDDKDGDNPESLSESSQATQGLADFSITESINMEGTRSHRRHDSDRVQVWGRLTSFLPTWLHYCADTWALEIISEGYSLKFFRVPPGRFFRSPLSSNPSKKVVTSTSLHHLIQIAAIKEVPEEERGSGIYSTFFTVPKKNRD